MDQPLFEARPAIRASGFALLPGFVRNRREAVLSAIASIVEEAPFTTLRVNGAAMHVEMTFAGKYAWHADNDHGIYQPSYTESHPLGMPVPPVPEVLEIACRDVLHAIGYDDSYGIDTVLVNRYANPLELQRNARLGKHRDSEVSLSQHIVC